MRISIVGLGGVGTILLPILGRYLNSIASRDEPITVQLIDADIYAESNADRQHFTRLGGKAEVQAEMYASQFPRLRFEPHSVYLDVDNVFVYVRDGDYVFCCVDNHSSRRDLSRHISTLSDAVLISGGNDYHDGNLQVYVRKNGESITPSLEYLHPEIEHPTDKHPNTMTCEELAEKGEPQLIFANATVAVLMCQAFWGITVNGSVPYTEQYFDLKTGTVRPVTRH
jgi:molybdopterin/thiamine biosynthesis adenylyltransferase